MSHPPRDESPVCVANRIGTARVQVDDADAKAGVGVAAAGVVDDGCISGFVSRIADDGSVTHRRLGSSIVDIAFDDDALLAVGYDQGPTFWRVPLDDSPAIASALPVSGATAHPERVLPGPLILGEHNPITSGVLNGWIVQRDGDAWRESIERGGGYSGFADATLFDGGFVAVGFGHGDAAYQGWLVAERNGQRTAQHFGGTYEIPSAIAKLPDGGVLVVGKAGAQGFATRFDASLALRDRVTWSEPARGVFEYSHLLVVDDTAWALALHGRLRHELDSATLVRLPLGSTMGPATSRPIPGAIGGALVHHDDLWLVTTVEVRRAGPTGPVSFARVQP